MTAARWRTPLQNATARRSRMRVLVTGATGFVGGAVCRALIGAGHSVLGFTRSGTRTGRLTALGVEVHTGDMRNPRTYQPLVTDVDAVVHAAQLGYQGRFTDQKAAELRSADAVMTRILADACQDKAVRLMYTSSCFVYGDRGDEWITEETPFAPSPLGAAHAAGVEHLRARVREGLDAVIVAPGFVYGPGGIFASSFYDQARKGRLMVIGNGRNFWSCIQVDDLAAAYVTAIEQAKPGAEYNVVDGEPLHLRELVDAVTDGMGRSRVGSIPPPIIGLMIGRPLVDSLITSFRIGNDKIRRELGWAPRFPSVRDGLPGTLSALAAAR
jgi:2-alkyl-3-oxoalkanoate reductase